MDIYEAIKIVKQEDLSPFWQEVVDQIGMEKFIELCYYFGGEALYFPKFYNITMDARDEDIRSKFDGENYKKLAREYGLSERQTRKIIDKKRGS